MPKVSLNDLASLSNETSAIATINANNTAIEEGFNNTISRDGTSPNTLEANIDMNDNRIYNIAQVPLTNSDVASKYYVDLMTGNQGDDTPTNPGDVIIDGLLTVNGGVIFDDGFYWDETNNRLSINNSSNTQTVAGTSYGADILVHNENNSELCLVVSRYSSAATAPACLIGTRARGTIASPTIVQSGDRLLLLSGNGYDGTDYATAGTLELYSDSTPGSNDMPGQWRMNVTPDGSQTPAEAWRVTNDKAFKFSGVPQPLTNDLVALGTSTISFSDLFLASGGVINFNNGNYTLTHSAGLLTASGNLSLGTSNTLTTGTIELGAASDTTLARSSAGNVSIEGNVIYRVGGTDVSVSDGGTGVSSNTAYAVLCGGTTSTNPIQSIASVGSSGQVLTSNGAGALPTFQTSAAAGWTLATVQATTSGTSFDFTSLPAGIKIIKVILNNVSLSGTDDLLIQIGDSGGLETTGYEHSYSRLLGTAGASTSETTGFSIPALVAARTVSGHLTLTTVDSGGLTWIASFVVRSNQVGTNSGAAYGGGNKTLSAVLDRVRLTRTGTDNFDNGQVNIMYM